MNKFNFLENSNNSYNQLAVISFFSILLILGSVTFKDYGISIDEEFQRSSGFYWLNYLLNFTPFEELKILSQEKFESIKGFTVMSPKDVPFYGIIFDVPLAFLEIILNIEESKNYFYLRHYINFLIFFLSSIFFYKILINRFSNLYISLIGTLFYVLSPRIYGASFYNNKDILFLSLFTITIFFCFKAIEKFDYKNLILLSLLASIATSTRIIGILIPATFSIIYLLSLTSKKNILKNIIQLIFFLILFYLFLIIHWPYLWDKPFYNFFSLLLNPELYSINMKTFFEGNYISTNFVPYKYIPVWIFITSPLSNIIFFICGISYYSKRLFNRFEVIDKKENLFDFWRGKKEKKDFYIFLNFFIILFYLIIFKSTLYNGWRHIYFLNFFITYFASFGFYIIYLAIKKLNKQLYLYSLTLGFSIFIIIKMFLYHPFQNIYFSNFISDNYKNSFEVDYQGTSGLRFLKNILKIEKTKSTINIGTASFYDMERSLALLNNTDKKRINLVYQDYKNAEYIYSNFISEVDKKIDDKYDVPKSFIQIDEFIIEGVSIYKVYKNIKFNSSK